MWQCLIATAKLPSITLYLWTGVELVNTINGGRFDRAARAFKVQLAVSEAGPWTEVLDEELEDPRRKTAPLPLQTFTSPSLKQDTSDSYCCHGMGMGVEVCSILPLF